MRYCDLAGAFETYKNGGNVTEYLRSTLDEPGNTDLVVEIAYDLQSGSYVDYFEKHLPEINRYIDEISGILAPLVGSAETVLDVGTGECTTFSGVAARCFPGVRQLLACDISWSRLYVGRQFLGRHLVPNLAQRTELFVSTLFALPLADKSVDVIWTSHALEPNGGREKEALTELFRVAKHGLCLFEPCYESNSPEGKARMERLGYIRNLASTISELGGKLEDCIPIKSTVNPLNPTHAFIVTVPASSVNHSDDIWACPATRYPLTRDAGYFYCYNSGLAYPILRGIPILRSDGAILATALRRPSFE